MSPHEIRKSPSFLTRACCWLLATNFRNYVCMTFKLGAFSWLHDQACCRGKVHICNSKRLSSAPTWRFSLSGGKTEVHGRKFINVSLRSSFVGEVFTSFFAFGEAFTGWSGIIGQKKRGVLGLHSSRSMGRNLCCCHWCHVACVPTSWWLKVNIITTFSLLWTRDWCPLVLWIPELWSLFAWLTGAATPGCTC